MSDPSAVRSPQTAAAERRAAPRYGCVPPLPCQVAVIALGPLGSGQVVDLSAGGLGLLLPRPVEAGSALHVQLTERAPPALAPLEVKVVHNRPAGDGRWFAGCALTRSAGPAFDALLAGLAPVNGTAQPAAPRPERAPGRDPRRSSVRLAVFLRGRCLWDDAGGARSCPVRARNLSHGGASLVFEEAPPATLFVALELSNPGKTFTCTTRARLLYQVEQPSGGYVVGASFPDRLDPGTLRALLS